MENNIKDFISSCDELIDCKFLVAEYKIQKMLQQLANTEEVCSLVGECLEQFNRDREFAKTFIQDGHGEFICDMPKEEYKIIALVFCTLVDIDNKKIDFTDFVKRFFGKNETAFVEFINTMVVPFRNLIAEAFGYSSDLSSEEDKEEIEDSLENKENNDSEENEEDEEELDAYEVSQNIAVQMLSELQCLKQDDNVVKASTVCRAIVKASDLRDEDVMQSLVWALKSLKVKQIKFMVKELKDIFDD